MTDQPQAPAPPPEAAPAASTASDLEAKAVADYLLANPDFFVAHEEVLASLRLPHQRGDTVSLVERQMKLLRDRNVELRHRLSHLMDVARDNDRLFEKTRHLIVSLLDASSVDDVVIAVEDSLRQEFGVPFVSLILFSDTPLPVGRWVPASEAHQAIGGLLSGGKAISGVLRDHELDFLFGPAQHREIGSTAMAPLIHQGLHGVLAIASRDPQQYKSSVGTLFLGYIAQVLGRVVPRLAGNLRSVR